MGITVQQLHVGGFDKNLSYILYDESTATAAVVDPAGDTALILAGLLDQHLTLKAIYLTHTHFDHYDGLTAIVDIHGDIPIYVHTMGLSVLETTAKLTPLKEGDQLSLGDNLIEVMHTPGHIDDAVCYFIKAKYATDGLPKVITGDTLFVGGCGRTNETRVKDLYESLQELKALPPKTVVYPGHDYGSSPTSTIGHEVATNQYYRAPNFTAFKKLRLNG